MEAGTPHDRHGAGLAAQVWGIYSSFAQLDDIVEEGILVLLSAVDKFDPSKDVKFETYVSKRLRGMIVDLARHQDWRRVKCGRSLSV